FQSLGVDRDFSNPTRVPIIPPVKEIACGGYQTGAISRNGQLYMWGSIVLVSGQSIPTFHFWDRNYILQIPVDALRCQVCFKIQIQIYNSCSIQKHDILRRRNIHIVDQGASESVSARLV
ncbi:hypothetical protein M758_6G134400, partial [Ceratodon purpureus]